MLLLLRTALPSQNRHRNDVMGNVYILKYKCSVFIFRQLLHAAVDGVVP